MPLPIIVNYKRRGARLLRSFSQGDVSEERQVVVVEEEVEKKKDEEVEDNGKSVELSSSEVEKENGVSLMDGLGRSGSGGADNSWMSMSVRVSSERDYVGEDFFDPQETMSISSNNFDLEQHSLKLTLPTPASEFYDAYEEMTGQEWFIGFFLQCCPYIAMILIQCGHAGMAIITKFSLNGGMSHYVLVVYRHAFATVAIAPFAILLERHVRPKMTFQVFGLIFTMALLGPVIDQNLYYAGLKFTSPTFSMAISNVLPAMTFLMALACRMETIDMKKLRCQAKVAGTVLTVAGAMIMTLYEGCKVNLPWYKHVHPHQSTAPNTSESAEKDWVKGSVLLIIATLAWSGLFILQVITLKKYPAHLSLTTLICLVGTLQAIVVSLIMEHSHNAWSKSFGWNIDLLSAAYAGVISTSIAYYIQGLVMNKRGPVFVTAFSPLMMIVVAIMGSFILAESIYLGSVIGAILIVIGLYSVLWGKYKEYQEKEALNRSQDNIQMATGNSHANSLEVKTAEADESISGSVTVTVNDSSPEPTMRANEAPNV